MLLYGGQYFCSGNDLAGLVAGGNFGNSDTEALRKASEEAVIHSMAPMLMSMATCEKPTFAAVQKGANGIAFTMLAHFDFIYCSSNAFF